MSSTRAPFIDLLRGLIMVFMALDHASAMIARVHFSEFWGYEFSGYPDLEWWFTRFVSHLCAPGFFFLMGMSMVLFGTKRLEGGWSISRIRGYFLKRGGFIIALMFFLEFPAWGLKQLFSKVAQSEAGIPGIYDGGIIVPSTVLMGLGICMIVGSILWRLNKAYLLAFIAANFAFSAWIIGLYEPTESFNTIIGFLAVPGFSQYGFVVYPLIPWLGVTLFGMLWGKLFIEMPTRLFRLSLFTGIGFILIFAFIKSIGWGNFQMIEHNNWISFFTLVKYPPSIAFALITIGLNLLLLALFTRVYGKWSRPLELFGQTAMFFYILHLYVYALLGAFFPMGSSILTMYLLWVIGLVPLFFASKWFLSFKRKQSPDSLWRMV